MLNGRRPNIYFILLYLLLLLLFLNDKIDHF